jgi:hypothetical protein
MFYLYILRKIIQLLFSRLNKIEVKTGKELTVKQLVTQAHSIAVSLLLSSKIKSKTADLRFYLFQTRRRISSTEYSIITITVI